MNFSGQDLLMSGIVLTGMAAIAVYKLFFQGRSEFKMYPPYSSCEFCNKKKLAILATCSQISRLEGCNLPRDHRHVECSNCKAQYLQRMRRWYD